MNASTPTKEAYFNYIGLIQLPTEVVDSIAQSGDNLPAIQEAMKLPEVKKELNGLTPKDLIRELDEYGAWTEEELKNHDDNLERILWIACHNIKEEEIDD